MAILWLFKNKIRVKHFPISHPTKHSASVTFHIKTNTNSVLIMTSSIFLEDPQRIWSIVYFFNLSNWKNAKTNLYM